MSVMSRGSPWWRGAPGRTGRGSLLVVLLVAIVVCSCLPTGAAGEKSKQYQMSDICKQHFLRDLYRKIDGAVLTSQNERELDCAITFQTHSILQRFMLRFDQLQLDCNDHLYIYDGAHAVGSYKANLSCRNTKQSVGAIYTRTNFVTLKYVTDAWGTNMNGFRLVITAVKDPKHTCKDFRCTQNEFCIETDLLCDGVNHCGDGSDEAASTLCANSEASTILGMHTTWFAVALVFVILSMAGLVTAAVLCFCRQRAATPRHPHNAHNAQTHPPVSFPWIRSTSSSECTGGGSDVYNDYYVPINLEVSPTSCDEDRVLHLRAVERIVSSELSYQLDDPRWPVNLVGEGHGGGWWWSWWRWWSVARARGGKRSDRTRMARSAKITKAEIVKRLVTMVLLVACTSPVTAEPNNRSPITLEAGSSNDLIARDFFLGPCLVNTNGTCPDEEVTFFLYTVHNPHVGQRVLVDDESSNLAETNFVASYPTKIIIHGYNSDMNLDTLVDIREQYLVKGRFNLIAVDWHRLAVGPCYPVAVHNVPHVGDCVAQLINRLREYGAVDIHAIGFSLGAHVPAYSANVLRPYKLPRITGLDPAMPLFVTVNKDEKLDAGDAEFVDVLHTNAFIQGKVEASGHIDFYMNGGINQPGCWEQRNPFGCDHHRSAVYYAESINSKDGFWGWPCSGFIAYLLGLCPPRLPAALLGDQVDRTHRGFHLVKTNSKKPYAQGMFSVNYRDEQRR